VRVVFAVALVLALVCNGRGVAAGSATACVRPPFPDALVHLPNVTKTLGGPNGWTTPFIVQNVGTQSVDLELEFLAFGSGDASIICRRVTGIMPGTSFADVPSNDADLPGNMQFGVLVRAFGSHVVAVVNQQAGAGTAQEADAYDGVSAGSTQVFLPNVVRRFYGFHSPLVIQSITTSMGPTTATATFVSFDGTKTASITRTLDVGRSTFIEPNIEPSLSDGTQYAVTITADHPISVVVNTHRDEDVATPVMYSVRGIPREVGAMTAYGPYAVKNVPGVGKGISTIVVQNMGTSAVTPMLVFTPLGGGSATSIAGQPTDPGRSWVFDPRYVDGNTTKVICGARAAPGCLADGEYSFVAQASGPIAAQVNVIWETAAGEPQSAAGYRAAGRPSAKVYLPNVTRTLGGVMGWTTPFIVQSPAASTVGVSWYRFSDGALVTTQTLRLAANSAQRIDPRSVAGLSDDSQYSVVLDGGGVNIAAIVTELNYSGGDGAMFYEGFAPYDGPPSEAPPT